MEYTLKSKLEVLSYLNHISTHLGSKFNVGLDGDKLKDARVDILRTFYENDPLAYAVSQGKDSYTKRIEPIEEKYGSFSKRLWIPEEDEVFDKEVNRVIGSMNTVKESYICPELFTTNERRSYPSLVGLFGGFVSGMVIGNAFYYEKFGLKAYFAIPAMASGIYLGEKLKDSFTMKKNLKKLRTVAKKTDEFLIINYI
jgi:hypothetical protein